MSTTTTTTTTTRDRGDRYGPMEWAQQLYQKFGGRGPLNNLQNMAVTPSRPARRCHKWSVVSWVSPSGDSDWRDTWPRRFLSPCPAGRWRDAVARGPLSDEQVVYLQAVTLTLVNRRHLRANVFAAAAVAAVDKHIRTICAQYVNSAVALRLLGYISQRSDYSATP